MRVLGVQVANGFASEARVLAGMFGHRPPSGDEVRALGHSWRGDRASADAFAATARVPVDRIDMGWRPEAPGWREYPVKVGARLRTPLALPAVVRAARRFGPDVVVSSQQVWDCSIATVAAQATGRSQVIHLHYIIGPWLGRLPLRRLRGCAHVITVSDFIRQRAIDHGVPPERVTTVRNAIAAPPPGERDAAAAVRAELGVPAEAVLVGMASRLDPYKGHRETIDAFAGCSSQHPGARLVIAGAGRIDAELRRHAATTPAADRILFLGQRRDIPRLLSAFDLFAHPSYDDPCPLAVLEAAAAGLPVVAFRSGGIPELVADGVTGLLTPPGDVDALAVALGGLLADPDRRHRMGGAARDRIKRDFRPEDASARFMGVLTSVAG